MAARVYTRVMARLMELARILPLMEEWLMALAATRSRFTRSAGAARRRPGHRADRGRARCAGPLAAHRERSHRHYQIVAPTSWNFSPRDAAGTPGALEAALVGAPLLRAP